LKDKLIEVDDLTMNEIQLTLLKGKRKEMQPEEGESLSENDN
jgi:hypothetical protein